MRQDVKSGATTYAVSQTSYDALGRVDCVVQRMNPATWASPPAACTLATAGTFGPDRITKNLYDAASQLTKVQTAFGTAIQADEVTNTYSNNGRLATVTDAENNRTTYEYDGHDRLTKTRYPSTTKGAATSSTTDYTQPTYDANGNVTALRLRDGQSIALTYDNLNRLTFKNLPGTEPDVTYAYDNLGRMTSATQTGNSLSFTYDALSRNLTQAGPQGTVTYQYDVAGRRTRATWPDSFYVTYDYLVTGEVSAIRENGAASGVGVLGTYAYDNLGRRTTLTRGNGAVTTWGYDTGSRLTSLVQNLSGTAHDLTLGFSYNPAAQITQATRSNDSYAWGGHFNVSRNYTSNGLNQYSLAGAVSLGYDGRGNLTTSGASSYGYSSENYLTSGPGVTLAYDPLGRLYQTVGAATTRLAYDGQDLIAEYNGSNVLQRRYVHGPGTDEPLVWYEGTGTTDRRWLHADERGSVIAVTDSAGTGVNSYDEYGIPASTNLGRFQYTGQTWIAELGMYHYKARFYSPTLGRFMQADPIGYADGMNLYAYTRNDPVNMTDPTGLACGLVADENGITDYDRRNGNCNDSGGIGRPVGGFPSNGAGPGGSSGGKAVAKESEQEKGVICSVIGLLGDSGRLRVGGDFGIGDPKVALGVGGIGISLRGDGSLEFDASLGAGHGLGYYGSVGVSLDNAGGQTRGGNANTSIASMVAVAVPAPYVGGAGLYGEVNTPIHPDFGPNNATGGMGFGLGPKFGILFGSVLRENFTYRTSGICE